jgi:hypothetical protein
VKGSDGLARTSPMGARNRATMRRRLLVLASYPQRAAN